MEDKYKKIIENIDDLDKIVLQLEEDKDYFLLSKLFIDLKQYDRAEKYLIMNYNTKDPVAMYNYIAYIIEHKKDIELAKQYINDFKAVDLGMYYYLLGIVNENDLQIAIKYYELASKYGVNAAKQILEYIEEQLQEEYMNDNDLVCGCEQLSFEDFKKYRLANMKKKGK